MRSVFLSSRSVALFGLLAGAWVAGSVGPVSAAAPEALSGNQQTQSTAPTKKVTTVTPPEDILPGDPRPRPELVRQPFSAADVEFMQGMIPHHAQALVMCAMAKPNNASAQLQLMCERMTISQRDEIAMMRTWLRDRGQRVPRPDATHHTMNHGGMKHDMLMPGMLNEEEMAALKAARGRDWDRLFLTGMIKHHQGAIDMVVTLFNSFGAAQDDDVYQFAADVQADQTAEIDRMQQMLAALGGGFTQ